MNLCTIDGCGRKAQARGWCNTHYWLWNIYGSAVHETPRKRKKRLVIEASARGDTTYKTGLPCFRGHIAPRIMGSGHCVECRKLISREKYRKDPSKQLAANSKWRSLNRNYLRGLVRAWDKKNQHRKNEHSAKRRALEIKAMPSWADRNAIHEIYNKAKSLGLVVDHIYPLQGKTVCGLHVDTNLQLMDATENKKKSNKFIDADGTAA